MADGKVIISTALDNSGLAKGVKGVEGALGGLKSVVARLGLAITAAFSVRAIASFAKECIDLGSDLAEVQNVVDVTFGGLNKQVDQFAKNAITQFGLSELAAKQYTSTMGAMLKSMGFSTDAAAEMGMEMAGLAGDMASFYNLETEDAFAKIRAGISGETEPLKQLGINLSVANLEQYALTQGITKSYEAMTEQEKVMLRYNYLLSATADAQGDFARTSDGWANQTRVLTEQFNSLKATLGQALINALTPALELINELIGRIQGFADYLLAFTETAFGDAGGGETATAATELAEGYDVATESAEDLQKAQRELAGFDEITRIGGSDESGSATSGPSTSVSAGVVTVDGSISDKASPKVQAVVKSIADRVRKLLQPLREIDFTPAVKAFGGLKEAIAPITSALFAGLEWAYTDVLVPLAAWTIEDLLPAFLDTLSGAFNVLNAVIQALQPLAQWLWDSFLQPIAAWTGGVIVEVLGWIADGLTAVSDWISSNQGVVQAMTGIVAAFVAAWAVSDLIMWIDAAGGLTAALWSLVPAIVSNTAAKVASKAEDIAIIALYAKDYIVAFGAQIAHLATSTAGWVSNTAAKVASTAAEWAQIAATTAWNVICAAATTVTTAFGAALAFLTSPIGLILLAITALIAVVVLLVKNWDKVKEVASKVWDGIKSVWSKVSSWFKEKVIDPITNFFKGMVNGIIRFINGMVSGVISGVNFIIRALNKISFDVPDWVPGIGGKTIGFNIKEVVTPQIPYLAQGAVLPANKPFLAMVGDQKHGTNIEAPLSTIQEAVAIVMEDVIASNIAGQEAIIVILKDILEAVLGIEIGDDVIGQATARYNRKMAAIRGGMS